MRSRPARLGVEMLEDRCVPAVFGLAWSDAQHLTLSFAPDGSSIAGRPSELFLALDAQAPTAVWQREILRAIQTWVREANLTVGIVADSGEPFGTPGPAQSDARFGDIRIGALPMNGDALAIAIPHDPFLAGTWAGDILVNSSPGDLQPGELFSAMLHEFGHALGIEESSDVNSVLFASVDPARTALSPQDIASVRAAYGPRRDANEGTGGNETRSTATSIKPSGEESSFDGSLPLVAFGDIPTASDVDVFKFKVPKEYNGPATVRLQTAGISLLQPTLTLYDSAGNVLGQSQSTNLLGDVLFAQASLKSERTYYVKVAAAAGDEFGVGRYGLAISFDSKLAISPDSIDAVLRGQPERLTDSRSNLLIEGTDSERNLWDEARELKTQFGFPEHTHYVAVGRLSNRSSENYYRLETPENRSAYPVVMTASVQGLSREPGQLVLQVLDERGKFVLATPIVRSRGSITVQTVGLEAGAEYTLRVSRPDGSVAGQRYRLSVDFRQTKALVRTFTQGSLTGSAPVVTNTLYVARTTLFQLLMSADGPPDASVLMTILNSEATSVFSQSIGAGVESLGSVLLAPGRYTVRFANPDVAPLTSPLGYTVRGGAISDPIGPRIQDPNRQTTQSCSTTSPDQYCYPDGIASSDPFYWLSLVY